MRTSEQIRSYLSEHNIRAVAKASGVHENVLYRFMHGRVDPRVSTWEKLNEYIDQKERATTNA